MTHPIDADRALFGEEFLDTTLQDAIAEVKSITEWPALREGSAFWTVMQAVASGDLIPKSEAGGVDDPAAVQTPQPGEVPASSAPALIPKADAEMAVALAYQRAAARVSTYFREQHLPLKERSPGAHLGVADAVLALAPAEPLAEVQALRDAAREYRASWHKEAERNNALIASFVDDMAKLEAARIAEPLAEVERMRAERDGDDATPQFKAGFWATSSNPYCDRAHEPQLWAPLPEPKETP